ncbi:MAG: hypothetical protein ACM336_21445 [Acidobacteriota bacterium]
MKSRRQESGFALVLVMALAAIIAVLLYRELPRVAFEGERAREELLIQRGEQYKRAIQLYMRRFSRYPASIEQLENTNNIRFLRRRYRDPMTGSEEWRLIHAGPGGVLTDSLTQKPPQLDKDGKPTVASITGRQADPNAPKPLWMKQRASDLQGFTPEQSQNPPDQQAEQQQPQQPEPSQPEQLGVPLQAQAQPPGSQDPNAPQQQPPVSPAPFAPQPAISPAAVQPIPGAQVSGGAAMQDPATNPIAMINQQLRGGSPRVLAAGGGGGFGSSTIGGGIAGVASKAEAEGIKVYRKHTKYNEWEFIYDQREDYANPALAGFGGGPAANPNQRISGPVK